MSVQHIPFDPWYCEPATLAALWRWLDYRGQAPDDPAYFMEEPWKWEGEYREMVALGAGPRSAA